MTANEKIWWEKTVEYAFVRRVEFLRVSPLDGEHEQAGDAIFGNKKDKFYLIEFKRDDSGQDAEKKKFKDKKEGYKELTAKYHFVVYGGLDDNEELELFSMQYLDYLQQECESVIPCWLFDEIFNREAVEQDEFLEYVHKIISLKKGDDIDAIGKSGSSSSAFANVLAINDKGECCSLLDIVNSPAYQKKYGLDDLLNNANNILKKYENTAADTKKVFEIKSIMEKLKIKNNELGDGKEEISNKYDDILENIANSEKEISELLKSLDKLKQKLTPTLKNSFTP